MSAAVERRSGNRSRLEETKGRRFARKPGSVDNSARGEGTDDADKPHHLVAWCQRGDVASYRDDGARNIDAGRER